MSRTRSSLNRLVPGYHQLEEPSEFVNEPSIETGRPPFVLHPRSPAHHRRTRFSFPLRSAVADRDVKVLANRLRDSTATDASSGAGPGRRELFVRLP